MKVTIKDIAKECGVSVATVSLAFSDKPSRISKTTKAYVLEVAERMHYQPNRVAVNLATKQSKWIGMIINDLRNTHISSLFMAIDQELQPKGYSLICHVLSDDNSNEQQIIKNLAVSSLAGIIWGKPYTFPENEDSKFMQRFIERMDLPIATMDDFGFKCPGIDVRFDYYKAGYMATRHLIENGHTRIGCLTGPVNYKVTQERLKGYKDALDEQGIAFNDEFVYNGDYTMQSGSEALSYLLGQRTTAVFSFNDEMAFGLYQSARQYRISIPDDLSIIGCDNVPFTNVLEVPLSTVHVPIDEMGKVMGQELIKTIEDKNNVKRKKVLYKPQLLLRGSTNKCSN